MRHRLHTFKIGRSTSHREAMLANMATSLIMHGEIQTTLVRAKELRRFAERIITLGKKGDLHRRRIALSRLRGGPAGETAVKHLFDVVAPSFATRQGGYTSIVKLGQRRGDAAEMCIIRLTGFVKPEKVKKVKPEADAGAAVTEPSAQQLIARGAGA